MEKDLTRKDDVVGGGGADAEERASAAARKKHKKHKKEKKAKKERRHRSKFRSRSSSSSSSSSGDKSNDDDEAGAYGPPVPFSMISAAAATSTAAKSGLNPETSFGPGLLQGEGQAIAEFARRNERIPRRGEVGYDGEKIQEFESLGYVMSGSRHKRMEAVRKRKENQIVSAEEKRLMVINETKKREDREAQVLEEMRRLIQKKEREDAAKGI